MKKHIVIALAPLIIVSSLVAVEGPRRATAEPHPQSRQQRRPAPQWVVDLVYDAGSLWGANAERMLEVIRCETGGTFDPGSRSPTGDHGIAQFHIYANGYSLIQETPYARPGGVWDATYDPVRSIYAMAYIWGTYPGTTGAAHWSCWRIIYGRGL